MHTVISVFDDQATAQRALDSLVQAGFQREDLHIEQDSAQGTTQDTLASDGTASGERDRGSMSNFGHFFSSLFGQDEPRHTGTYSEAVRRGSAVLVVDAEDETQAERAASMLHGLGAVDVDERAKEWRASGWKDDDDLQTGKEGVMDVVQEELQVGKRSLDRGGVRVVQRVSEKPVRELLRLREEHVSVDRRAVDRPATQQDLANFKEGTLEVREMAEEPVVAKSARVVEEVRVGKEVQEREQVIEDTVRRKDVDVERIPGQGGTVRETEIERERAVAANRLNPKDKPTR